jgi:hypothetical protein
MGPKLGALVPVPVLGPVASCGDGEVRSVSVVVDGRAETARWPWKEYSLPRPRPTLLAAREGMALLLAKVAVGGRRAAESAPRRCRRGVLGVLELVR